MRRTGCKCKVTLLGINCVDKPLKISLSLKLQKSRSQLRAVGIVEGIKKNSAYTEEIYRHREEYEAGEMVQEILHPALATTVQKNSEKLSEYTEKCS